MSDIVPFGKYKGKPVEELIVDRKYCEWLLAQPWLKDSFQPIYNIIIHGVEPQDTPDHNAMQARFLEPLWTASAVWLASGKGFPDYVDQVESLIKTQKAIERPPVDTNRDIGYTRQPQRILLISHLDCSLPLISPAAFEVGNVDVSVFRNGAYVVVVTTTHIRDEKDIEWQRIEHSTKRQSLLDQINSPFPRQNFFFEIKPVMGDDYPSVLRQMVVDKANVLLLREYTGRAVSLDSVIQIFASRNIVLILEDDVQKCFSERTAERLIPKTGDDVKS